MTKEELLNLKAFMLEMEGNEDDLPLMDSMYEYYMKGEKEAWKDLEWKMAKKLEWWATRWGLNEEVKA